MMNLPKIEKQKLINEFQNALDSSKYLVYEDTLEIHENYALINFQSKSMVLNNEVETI